MGKNRHSKDRLFITQTEHKYLYGGKKAEIKRAYRRTDIALLLLLRSMAANKPPLCVQACRSTAAPSRSARSP